MARLLRRGLGRGSEAGGKSGQKGQGPGKPRAAGGAVRRPEDLRAGLGRHFKNRLEFRLYLKLPKDFKQSETPLNHVLKR